MSNSTRTNLAPAVLLATGVVAGTAFAGTNPADEKREATALQGAKVTLCQAIATAEQQTGGHAFDAGADVGHGAVRIAVETNGPKGVQTVFVDAKSGEVVGMHAGGEND